MSCSKGWPDTERRRMTGAPSLRTAARSSPVSRRAVVCGGALAVVPYTVTGQRPSSPASAPPHTSARSRHWNTVSG